MKKNKAGHSLLLCLIVSKCQARQHSTPGLQILCWPVLHNPFFNHHPPTVHSCWHKPTPSHDCKASHPGRTSKLISAAVLNSNANIAARIFLHLMRTMTS